MFQSRVGPDNSKSKGLTKNYESYKIQITEIPIIHDFELRKFELSKFDCTYNCSSSAVRLLINCSSFAVRLFISCIYGCSLVILQKLPICNTEFGSN